MSSLVINCVLIPLILLLVSPLAWSTVTPSPSRFSTSAANRTKLIYNEELTDKEILDDLLSKQRYDKRIIPPSVGPVVINVSVLLLSLASPDESSLKYEIEFLMTQTWADPRLAYEAGSHTSLNAIHHHNSMWLPDTYFVKHGDFKDLQPFNIAVRVYQNGTVLYTMRRHLILWCQGNLNIFPFDDPVCRFLVESVSYEKDGIVYQWSNNEGTVQITPSLASLNAYLILNKTTSCPDRSWRGNLSCLMVELTFTRDKAFYFTTVFIPDIILVTSSFITFWLEWNAVPARVLIGVTTMLNFFTTSNNFRSTLPVVSNLTAMNLWDGVCMCFIYASLLEFVAVNYVGRKRPRPNTTYRPGEDNITEECVVLKRRTREKLASLRGRLGQTADPKQDAGNDLVSCAECGAGSCIHPVETVHESGGRHKGPIHPVRMAKTIDVISRTVFPTCFAVFLIFFFVNYKGTERS